MMFMTAKVDLKKILLILALIAVMIVGAIWVFGGGEDVTTAAPGVSTNDGRIQFLRDFGWQAAASPVESSQVKIPKQSTEVFDRYNSLQKSQGYDLTQYAGKHVMRFVYRIENYPGATEPVYATLLVYKNQVIGGDITDTAAGGRIQGFQMVAGGEQPESAGETTAP